MSNRPLSDDEQKNLALNREIYIRALVKAAHKINAVPIALIVLTDAGPLSIAEHFVSQDISLTPEEWAQLRPGSGSGAATQITLRSEEVMPQ